MGFVAAGCQASTLGMLICPEAKSAQNNIAAVSADGSTVWVLILLEHFVQPLDCIGSAQAAPLAGGQAREGEQMASCGDCRPTTSCTISFTQAEIRQRHMSIGHSTYFG